MDKKDSIFDHIVVFSVALVISMPLFSSWFGSAITYMFYIFGVASAVSINRKNQYIFSKLDLPVFLFFLMYLLSVFYAVNSDFKTELLFIPLLFILYYGGKGIAKYRLTNLLFTYVSILFVLFTIYLLFELSKVGFKYNAYYFYTTASNKVDYLTTSMYAGITFIYAVFAISSSWFKIPLVAYSFFIVAISGARFSIFFISTLAVLLLLVRFKKVFFTKITFIFIGILFLFSPFLNDYLNKKQFDDLENIFAFSIMRISHFNKYDTSLQERNEMIDKSTTLINSSPLLG